MATARPLAEDWTCLCLSVNAGWTRVCEYCGRERVKAAATVDATPPAPPVPTDRAFAAVCLAHMKRIMIGSGPRGNWAKGEHVAWIRETACRFPAYYPEGPDPEVEAWERYERDRDAKDAERAARLADERRAVLVRPRAETVSA